MTGPGSRKLSLLQFLGQLPPGHRPEVTMEQLYAETVAPFPDSRTRQGLFDGLSLIRSRIGLIRMDQWVGGPFATNTAHPELLHCLSLFDVAHFFSLSDAEQRTLTEALELWCNRTHTQTLCGCHSALAMLVPEDNPRRALAESIMRAWLGRFAHGKEQGHYVVPLIPESDNALPT